MTDILSPYEQALEMSQEHDDTQFQKMSEMWKQRRDGHDIDTEMQKVEDERAQNILRARQLWHRLAPAALLETDKVTDSNEAIKINEELNQLKNAWNITDDELNIDYAAQFNTLWSDYLHLIQGEWSQAQAEVLARELNQQPVMKYLFDRAFSQHLQAMDLQVSKNVATLPQYLSLSRLIYSPQDSAAVEDRLFNTFFAQMLNWDVMLSAMSAIDLSQPLHKDFMVKVLSEYIFRYSTAEQSELRQLGARMVYRGKELVNAEDVDQILNRVHLEREVLNAQLVDLFIQELHSIFTSEKSDEVKIKRISDNMMRYLSLGLPSDPHSLYSLTFKEFIDDCKKKDIIFPWEKLLSDMKMVPNQTDLLTKAKKVGNDSDEKEEIPFEILAKLLQQGQADFEVIQSAANDADEIAS